MPRPSMREHKVTSVVQFRKKSANFTGIRVNADICLFMESHHYIPCEALKPYVRHFSISETPIENSYRVLPETGLVMGFQFKGKLYQLIDGKEIELSQSGITGLNDTFRQFKNSDGIGTVLVHFHDGAASAFFREPIHELFKSSVSLDNFLLRSELLLFEERLCEAATHLKKVDVVEQFLISRTKPGQADPLVVQALGLIYQNKGNIRMGALSDQLHISQSPFEKRFRKVVGTSPKKFASIVRLKHVMKRAGSAPSLTALGYEAGFYDQAHFIKEFKRFTGDTPEEYFRTE
jgi:AraC-like DNA-binding protein